MSVRVDVLLAGSCARWAVHGAGDLLSSLLTVATAGFDWDRGGLRAVAVMKR